ncbi:mannose-1-phosphate guanylyltransferase [Aureitalea marina]|uniref:mannose-1-phosphate guanylyltransferase n=1 Tax=Aureitalea marina TaxID=930804 RepID=A0A2S7KQU4_9FLAO|nr:mannose-1-phosphate guanylyltransferase [Aureitalea marina]PQB04980.1 mannose-1-phosphate guanylyltransferase [Aureitalea marina]
MNNNYYAVIMAGGIGSRFWPVSTSSFPKQFHDMLGTGQSLLQKTFSRLNQFVPASQINVLTNASYTELVCEQLPEIDKNQVVPEPAMRNTAPCILWSAMRIYKENPDALMLVAPSDHWIEDELAFKDDVLACFDLCAQEDVLVTLGIVPDFPNTGYGYIEKDKTDTKDIPSVLRFCEKPDYDTAKQFLESGNFLWNAGIFIWSARSILKAFKEFLPKMYALFSEGDDSYHTDGEMEFINSTYPKAENISIDYGIMEKAANVRVKNASFDWNDLGTWGALFEKMVDDPSENAVVRAKPLLDNANSNMIYTSKEKLVVVDGLDDYIIVDKDDVLLIFPKQKQQEIKELLQKVNSNFGDQYT